MSPLHSLRLNCLLAPLLAALVGAAAVLAGALLHRQAAAAAATAADLAAAAGLARLIEGGAASPSAWLAAHPGWSAAARLRLDGDLLAVVAGAGAVPAVREPPPELLLAYDRPQAWRDGGAAVAAAPCLAPGEAASVVVLWRSRLAGPPWWPWLALAGGVLLLGGGAGAYLVRHVYRPVAWLEQAALAAAEGRSEPPGAPDSPETASLRSSIALLTASRRDGPPS